ncbi:hypothetical protein CLAFUW4_08898 [Fulvia fulva]|uniref:Uncharacterized protein n=1 Tax=Passalora fulva TaxID=5499 RepID=A0A9Q8UTE1_PASFU|nr:uncharacterized protein CLAFUR5_09006 [Fulvia fulva]KAK4613536.1 hypothetical protein CLAFUR4_08904 [Fulvia fulva]KAK4615030.1 hypothetical protein CLAFUR0_08896 [Fulvia fulva]UJO21776.1 hypothetical protein CLAFUR5_09006 [Fulvia fulva]WPV20048.1 hypothetical protein CLAFUW4_08898 [Fulvia fulva]WPV35137.1 hypothetical protein CLAFUW7_08899 [Fulvia fulva]
MPATKLRALFPKSEPQEWHLQPNCRLLQLPGELRNRIYHLVLIDDHEENNPIRWEDDLSHRIKLKGMKMPALVGTCRQVQHEALTYLFRFGKFSHKFTVDDMHELHYRLGRSTKRWMKLTGANKMYIHDCIIGYGADGVGGNTFHSLGAQCDLVDKDDPYRPPWYNKVYAKLGPTFPPTLEGYTVESVALFMTVWVWAPSGRLAYTLNQMAACGAKWADEMRMKALGDRLRQIHVVV